MKSKIVYLLLKRSSANKKHAQKHTRSDNYPAAKTTRYEEDYFSVY